MAVKPTRKSHRWQSAADDAIRLAAFRWFALELERLSIEIYASDKSQYAAVEAVMRQALKGVGALKPRRLAADGDCPDGYFLCKDGLCAPACDGIVDTSQS